MVTSTRALVAVGVAVVILAILLRVDFPVHEVSVAPIMTHSTSEIRRDVRAAIDKIIDLAPNSITQTTESLGHLRSGQLKALTPASFPSSTYRLQFGDDSNRIAFQATTEIATGHYISVAPGFTPINGCVSLEGGLSVPKQACLRNDELEYLLWAVYRKFCYPMKPNDGVILNRFKDVVLSIRFGQQTGMGDFHKGITQKLNC